MNGKTIMHLLAFVPMLYPLAALRPIPIMGVGVLCGASFWLLDDFPLPAVAIWFAALLVGMRCATVARREKRQRRLLDAIETFTLIGPRQAAPPRAGTSGGTNVGVRLGHMVPLQHGNELTPDRNHQPSSKS